MCLHKTNIRKERGSDMFTEEKLEQHYSSIPSDTLHIIRDEYKWALEECGVHNDEQLRYIEKALSLRGESFYREMYFKKLRFWYFSPIYILFTLC